MIPQFTLSRAVVGSWSARMAVVCLKSLSFPMFCTSGVKGLKASQVELGKFNHLGSVTFDLDEHLVNFLYLLAKIVDHILKLFLLLVHSLPPLPLICLTPEGGSHIRYVSRRNGEVMWGLFALSFHLFVIRYLKGKLNISARNIVRVVEQAIEEQEEESEGNACKVPRDVVETHCLPSTSEVSPIPVATVSSPPLTKAPSRTTPLSSHQPLPFSAESLVTPASTTASGRSVFVNLGCSDRGSTPESRTPQSPLSIESQSHTPSGKSPILQLSQFSAGEFRSPSKIAHPLSPFPGLKNRNGMDCLD